MKRPPYPTPINKYDLVLALEIVEFNGLGHSQIGIIMDIITD